MTDRLIFEVDVLTGKGNQNIQTLLKNLNKDLESLRVKERQISHFNTAQLEAIQKKIKGYETAIKSAETELRVLQGIEASNRRINQTLENRSRVLEYHARIQQTSFKGGFYASTNAARANERAAIRSILSGNGVPPGLGENTGALQALLMSGAAGNAGGNAATQARISSILRGGGPPRLGGPESKALDHLMNSAIFAATRQDAAARKLDATLTHMAQGPASTPGRGGRRRPGFNSSMQGTFAGRAMVAGGALTGLTGQMAFLGPAFASMSGGLVGGGIVGAATALGMVAQSGFALEDRLKTLAEKADDFGGALGIALKQVRDESRALSLGRDILALNGFSGASKARTGFGIYTDQLSQMGLDAFNMLTGGVFSNNSATTAGVIGKQALQAQALNLQRKEGRALLDSVLVPEKTVTDQLRELAKKFPEFTHEVNKATSALMKQNMQERFSEISEDSRRRSDRSAEERRRSREGSIRRGFGIYSSFRDRARSIEADLDTDFTGAALKQTAREMARVVAFGGLSLDSAARAAARPGKAFNANFESIEGINRRIQQATASRGSEPTKDDITKMRDAIVKELKTVNDRGIFYNDVGLRQMESILKSKGFLTP